MDYNKFPSMITKSSELVIGLVFFHVYGHITHSEPEAREVIKEPYIENGFRCYD